MPSHRTATAACTSYLLLAAACIVCLSPAGTAAAEQLAKGAPTAANSSSIVVRGETAAAKSSEQQGCPRWLQQYEDFHAATRGKSHAKYLVFSVDGEGGGLGDRMRGATHGRMHAAQTSMRACTVR